MKFCVGCTEGDVCLVGGHSSLEGRIKVCHYGKWRTVCDNNWGRSEGIVACRQLGYSFVRVDTSGSFGRGRGQPWLNQLSCIGYEDRLDDCYYNDEYSNDDCSYYNDAGLVCDGR